MTAGLPLVTPGSHVVELGGGTGVMSFLASRRARKVTMVERLPHVAAAARLLLSRNGVADMPNMSLPLPHPIAVNTGDRVRIRFQYDAGGSIESLQSSMQASVVSSGA